MEFITLKDYPNYEINKEGDIRNKEGRFMRYEYNDRTGLTVRFNVKGDRFLRNVGRLVAENFVPRYEADDTVIYLDGDRRNCNASNLKWAPRWYAINYHRQFTDGFKNSIFTQVINLDTGKIYPNGRAVCVEHGLLSTNLMVGIVNKRPVYPSNYIFDFFKTA